MLMSKLSFWVLIPVFLSACSGEYITKNCLGRIENFDEKVLQAEIHLPLSYLIDGKSVKVKFSDQEIEAHMASDDQASNAFISSNKGDNYFSFLLNGSHQIEYEFNSDKWFVGTCK